LSYLSEISKSKTLNSFNFSANFSDHFLFVIIVAPGIKLGIALSKESELKAKTILTFLVKNFSFEFEMLTSKKFTHHFILDSYSISVIKSYQSSAKRPDNISTVEFTQAPAAPVILIFKFKPSVFVLLFIFFLLKLICLII
jgi:hypothetical protein